MVDAVKNKRYMTIFVTGHPHKFSYVTSLIEVFLLCDVQALQCLLLLNAMCCCLVMDIRDRALFTSSLSDKIITPVWLQE